MKLQKPFSKQVHMLWCVFNFLGIMLLGLGLVTAFMQLAAFPKDVHASLINTNAKFNFNGMIFLDPDIREEEVITTLPTIVFQGKNQNNTTQQAVAEQIFQIGWASTEQFKSMGVDVGDIDGDGDLDIVFANGYHITPEPNQIYLNDGLGNFQLYWQQSVPESLPSTDVALGDYDNDGDLDVMFGNNGDPDQLYRNDFPQGFQKVWQSDTLDPQTKSVAWGDLDSDGDLDLFIATQGYYVVYENQNGNFVLVVQATTPNTVGAGAIADVNNDGDLDIILAMSNSASRVYENTGNFNFSEYAVFGNGLTPTGVALAHTNQINDDEIELGLSAVNLVQFDSSIKDDGSLVWNDTNATNSSALVWGDYDLDGLPDLAVAKQERLYYLIEHSTPNSTQMTFLFEYEALDADFNDLAWGDFDEDGDLDLVVANGGAIWNGMGKSNYVLLNQATPTLAETWLTTNTPNTIDVLTLGDVNGDGYLDILAAGPGRTYINQQDNTFGTSEGWHDNIDNNVEFAVGDIDGDFDLDIVTVGEGPTIFRIQTNDGTGIFTFSSSVTNPDNYYDPQSVALGDIDGDNDLDIFVGNSGQENIVYRNNQNSYDPIIVNMTDQKMTTDSTFVDLDQDGYLDIVIANDSDVNQVYRNIRGQQFELVWESNDTQQTTSVTTGDFNADGLVDLAFGNFGQADQVFLNDENFTFSLFWESISHFAQTETITTGDIDGDGDQDVLAVYSGLEFGSESEQYALLYRNDNDNGFTIGKIYNDGRFSYGGADIALGDTDRDGDLDIVLLYVDQIISLRENMRVGHDYLPNNQPYIHVEWPYHTPQARGHFLSEIIEEPTIPITYTIFDEESDPLLNLQVFFSTDGGGKWQPATPTPDIITYNLGALPFPAKSLTNTHLFKWDTFADGLFGEFDDLSLRFVAYPQLPTAISATAIYTNITPHYMWPYQGTTINNLRIRGTSIRVISGTMPVSSAIIYQIPNGQSEGSVLASNSGETFVTNQQGYLQGRGNIHLGDQLVAMMPITETDAFTLYHTNATATVAGLDTFEVIQPGVQELVVSSDNPLILFNLAMALEWDARNDPGFLDDLDGALKLASEVLFDASNGQMALSEVRVTLNKENWLGADVVLFASSSIRPMANIGGVVDEPTPDIGVTGVLTDAFTPGQVRLGPSWDPYGISTVDLGQDWQQALAHELSHYLLFLPDNYIGIQNGNLIDIDCVGSMMTSEDYSEFLRPDEWTGDCLNTVAAQETSRSDWETITNFYPWLAGKVGATQLNSGPARLPLAVTQMTLIEPAEASAVLPARFFDVRAGEGGQELLLLPRAEGYLHKTNNTLLDESDDRIIQLGKTGGGGDRLYVRGAEVGDRVCINDATTSRYGCETVTATNSSVHLYLLPDWQADIESTPVTSRTMEITVTVPVSVLALTVQVIPAYGAEATPDVITATVATMRTADGGLTWSETITLPHPAFEGIIRVYAPVEERETIAAYTLNSAFWGGSRRGWGGSRRGWGGSRRGWGAPISSGDGQVTVFNADDPFGSNGISSLQALPTLPNLPSWLTPVGKGYRILQESGYDQEDQRYVSFNYLESQVPPGYEYALHIYYTVDEQAWQRLDTRIDHLQNMATAALVDDANGSYALVVTVDISPFDMGWNTFGYPIPETNPITSTLASIEGKYTMVAHFDGTNWLTYDPVVALQHPQFVPTVNTLMTFQFTEAYWLNATEAVTLSVGVPGGNAQGMASVLSLPPAVYFGWVVDGDFTPSVGDTVEVLIDEIVCGTATVFELDGNLAYRVNVLAETFFGDPNGCGTDGAMVSFRVDGQQLSDTASWKNSMAWYLPLTTTIADTTAPVLTIPNTITVEAESGAGTVVTYTVTAIDNLDPNPSINCTPVSGSMFSLGITAVACTATDGSGNSVGDNFNVVVVDTTTPVLTVPETITVEAESGAGTVVAYSVTATDSVDSNPSVNCTPVSGSLFSLGITTVACTATDGSGNSVNDNFNVVVVDTTAPVLTVPETITVEAESGAGTAVTYSVTATDSVDSNPSVNCTPVSGSIFSLGITSVACTTVDGSGNSANGDFNVTVVDTTAPVLTVPEAITVEITNGTGTIVTYTVTATDTADPNPNTVCTPASNNFFPLGTTTVNCTATDANNNSSNNSFPVIIIRREWYIYLPLIIGG